jgi:hypothetical protein
MALTLSYRNNNTAGTSVSAVSGNNNGGVIGGVGYLGEKTALGFLSSVEGIWDYTAGGIAKLFGADQWAERQFVNNWVNYNHADEWYDPGKGWQIAGDVAGGIGTSLPAIGGVAAGVGIAALSGGTLSPVAAGIISASVAGLGAAGNATKQAYQKTGQLGLKEFGYGALSGATEAGIEALTAGLGTGTGRIVSSLSKRAAGETVSTLGKSGAFSLLKTLGADFASEAVEEGLAEVLDPVYQRWSKVDPEAKNATGKEIGYAALVGGLSGLVMSGGALTVNTTANLFSGEGAVSNGTAGSIINTARQISEYESANDTGYESFKRIRDGYEQLSASLIGTGGQVSTVKQKMLLGSLKRAETAAFVEPFIERSAMALLTNADSAAERFSALGMTDAGGKAINFTADQIRSGVDASLLAKMQSGKLSDTDRKTLTRQLRAAIGTNSVLTSLAVMDATGRISMDTERFAQAALRGEQIADAADLNRFIETASPAQIEALSEALKIDNWAALTPDVFRAKVAEFHTSPEGQAYISQLELVKQAQSISDTKSKNLPRLFRSNTVAQGMTHYTSADGRVNMALLRDGDRYHLYDYESGNVSREMTISELNSTMRPYWNAQSTAQAAQDAQKPMDAQTQGQTQENATQSQTAAQAVRLNIIAAENISDWNKLSEPNRAAVRMTMRQAIAAGLDEDTALTFGRVAARSGMNIVFSAEQSGEGDARISGNTIYIDPNADKGRMENKLLLHEAGHALMRERDGARLIARAFETVAPDRSGKIAQKYQKFYQQRGMSMDQYLPIVDEEIATAGIEDTLGNINAWDYILREEPSFGDKILNFFRKSAQDYSSSAGLSREARKLLNAYKKMFAELSERNRGNNAITLANEVEYGRQDVDYEQIAKGRKSQRVHGERLALPEDEISVRYALPNESDTEKLGIHDQIKLSQEKLNAMQVVFKASVPIKVGKAYEAGTWAIEELKKYGFHADRQNFGKIYFDEESIRDAMKYLDTDAEKVSIVALYSVLKRGIQIGEHGDHKSRGKHTITFAAPVELNGIVGNMAVVVNMRNNKYKVHRILMPDGSMFKFLDKKIDTEQEMQRGVPKRSLANATSSVSGSSISQKQKKINRNSKKSSDERLALPEDGEKKKKYHMSHGQLRADVANKTRKKAYSKADARETMAGLTGADLLSKKVQNELADYLWQGFNTCETIDERQTFAKNFAQELGKRIYLVQDESPDAEMYRERVTYLGAGIGRLMISSGDYAGDFRHRLDKDGYKSFYARWSFGQNASKNGFTPYSVDKYVNDIAGEVPGMEYLREMHTADAMLEIDRLYTEAKAGAKAKVDLYTKDEIDALMGRFEEHIMKAFDERGRQSTFQKQVDKAIIDISQKADRSLRKMQKEVDEANQRYQDVLGDDKVVITKGQAQKQQAEFKSDRVYSRVDVSRAFEAIPVYNNIPSDVRRAFESEVWQGLNVRTTQNARELYLVDQVSNKLFQTILNEALTDEKMRELNDIEKQKRVAAKKLVGEERKARIKALNNQQNSILDDHAARFTNSLDQMEINRILDNAAKAIPTLLTAGKMSKKAAMEAEFDMSTAGYWKKEYEDAIERNKVLSRISVKAQKMKDLKMGTFSNATQMESDVFKGSIQKLASIEYRGNLSVTKAKNALRELAAWYTQEQKPLMYVDDQNPGYYNKGVAEMLRALTETDEPFTNDQLSVLQDVMSYFVKFVENYGKIWRGNKWIDAKTEAERYVAQITKNADLKTNTFDRMMRTRYINSFGDPHSVVKQQDRYEDGFSTEMFEDIRKAALDADVQLMNVMSDYDAFMEKNPKYMKQAAKQQIRWVEDGRTNTMPKMAAIGLYMTSKREHAQAGLALNGFKFKDADGNIVRAGAIIRNADPKEVTQAQIGEAISDLQSRIRKQLSAEDLEYIKILEKGYGYDLRALKAERDMARQGFTNVTTGYYYPIRRADIAKSIDTSVFSELDRVSNASFNKSIVDGARGKLFIEDADVLFHRHAVAVTRYSALSPVIESFNILFNMDTSGNPNNAVSVATMIEAQWPKAKEYFRDLIADVQGVSKNLGEYSDTLANLRSYVAMSQLGANLKTWVTQFSSLFAASSILDTTSIMSGILHASKDVDAYCDLAKLRNYESAAIKAQGVLDKVSSVGEALMKPIAWTDRLVVNVLWGACQVQVQKNSKMKIGTDENKVEAGKLLTEVLFETQQNSLATERSAMMRSGNELIRALTMFSADGMKVTGRFLDGIGEVSVLKRRLDVASADEKPAIEKKLKKARKKSRRATAAMVSSAVFAVAIAECFRWLYAKEREEDENAVIDMTLDFVGNLLGGLPGLRDVYTFFVDGYELDNYAISAVNDLLTSVKSSFSLAWDIVRGEGDTSEIPAKVKNLAYAAGQFTGLPVRNVYNVISGLTRRVAPQAGYKLDSVFYKKNYRTDLRKAVEEGDARRVSMLMGLISGKDITGQIGEEGMSELNRLALTGASVLPRTVSNTVSVNGEEIELDRTQVEALNEAYSESWGVTISSMLSSSAYASMSDSQKEKAIRKAHEISYEQALVSIGIDRGERSVLIASVLGSETAAVYYALTSGISSDVGKNGETVEGSRRAKVISSIRSMNLGRDKTLLLISLAGYSLQDGDIRGMKAKSEKVMLLQYIMKMPGYNSEQKAQLAKACGFDVKNGRVMMSSL